MIATAAQQTPTPVRPADRVRSRPAGGRTPAGGRAPVAGAGLLAAALAVGCGGSPELVGAWHGYAESRGETLELSFELAEAPYGYTGTLDLPTVGVLEWPLTQVVLEGDSVTIDFRSDAGRSRAVGRLDAGRIGGTIDFAGVGSGTFRLERVDAPAPAPPTEEVSFANGDVELAGRLTLPPGPGPHPAIVFVHGSGDVTRDANNFMAARHAANGVATLGFDKRGAGASSGDWRRVGLDALAADVVAGVDYLAGRDDIDASRIGLQGQSQGGWTAPLAASLSDRVAFLITISGPLVTPAVEGHWDNVRSLALAGHGRDAVDRTLGVLRLADDAIRTGSGWDAVQRATEALFDEPWFDDSRLPRRWEMSEDLQSWYRKMMDFDPVPVFQALDIPVLAIYGAEDESIPAEQSARALQYIAQQEGKAFDVAWFPDADHGLRVGPTADRFRWPGFAPGFLEQLDAWVARQVAP